MVTGVSEDVKWDCSAGSHLDRTEAESGHKVRLNHKTLRPVPGDLLPFVMLQLLKFPQPSQNSSTSLGPNVQTSEPMGHNLQSKHSTS